MRVLAGYCGSQFAGYRVAVEEFHSRLVHPVGMRERATQELKMYDPTNSKPGNNSAIPSPSASPGAQRAPSGATGQTSTPEGRGDDYWPKEEQRLRNGACGQVSATHQHQPTHERLERKRSAAMGARPYQSSGGGAVMSKAYIPDAEFEALQAQAGPEMERVIPFADEALNQAEKDAKDDLWSDEKTHVYALCLAMLCGLTRVADAIREVAPELAGAISENGTDIGAGIALALEQVLKTPTDDNTHNQ